MLKSTVKSRGDRLELRLSEKYHQMGIPLLISSAFLRSMGCGQVDLAYIKKKKIIMLEVKSWPEALGGRQLARLNRSVELISCIFDAETELKIVKN